MCENCRYFMYDSSTGAADCKRYDDMTEEVFEKHFTNNEDGCPCFSECEAGYDDLYAEGTL